MKKLREMARYPAAVVSLIMVLALLGIAVYAVVSMPYAEAVRLWRGAKGIWSDYSIKPDPVGVYPFLSGKLAVANSVVNPVEDAKKKN